MPTTPAVEMAHYLADLSGSPDAEDKTLAVLCDFFEIPVGTFNHLKMWPGRLEPQVKTSVEVEIDIVDRMIPGIREHPLFGLLPSCVDVVRMSDVISLRGWLAHPLFADIMRPAGIPVHGVLVPIDIRSGCTFVMLNRDTDFDETEVRDLTFLQGAMIALGRRDAVQRIALMTPDSPLTRREHEVLLLLDAGLTVAAIGRQLLMQPRTAAKHIESIHRKLGTIDRLSTVRQATQAGWLPQQRA